jgi:F-type H+-transporting ATPase subunit delta
MIRAASREALAELDRKVDAAVGSVQLDSFRSIAGDLFDVAAVFSAQPQLRRMLGDASTDVGARASLVDRLFDGKIGDVALSMVRDAVSLRWSSPWDMTDALEIAGDRVLMDLADRRGALDDVEDEVFRFGRILDANDELRSLLDEQVIPAGRRVELLHGVLDGKANEITVELLDRAVRSGRKRSIVLAIDDLLNEAAWRRQRSTAYVRSAVPLTEEQSDRLTAALATMYGRNIDVRAEVDPAVRGGLVVRVGDEQIDGSVAGRLAAVRAALQNQ